MSLAKALRNAIRKAGVNFHVWPSERHLALDYRVSDRPRYGYKVPSYAPVAALLDARREAMAKMIAEIAERHGDLIASIPEEAAPGTLAPHWNNGWFFPLDACVLMHLLLDRRPRRLVEIGSGNSTLFARRAISSGDLRTHITSIDPQPRAGIDSICDAIVRSPLEDVDQAIFDDLEAGDILFFDGSHRVFQDSDVTVFFLEILPRLAPGVIVHIHDIFWPDDYPPEWGSRFYSEQYMLAMLLLHAPERYPVVFASAYASNAMNDQIEAFLPGKPGWGVFGTSFWLETR